MKRVGKIILILALPFILSGQVHIDSAKKYINTKEVAPNRGPDIDRWNRFVKNPMGAPYCAAFVSSMIKDVSKLKSGLATRLITKNSISADEAIRGVPIPPGSIVIWRKGSTSYGHAGLVESWNRDKGVTIEGNTSAGRGSQSDGDGVYRRFRKIEPFSYFRIVSFTPVN